MAGDQRYRKSSAEYGRGHQRSLSAGAVQRSEVPCLSDVMARRQRIRRPVTAMPPTGEFRELAARKEEVARQLADSVPYAPVTPKKFHGKDVAAGYPESARRGADNPLYWTCSMSYGEAPPAEHQTHEFWFPKGHDFAKTFTDPRPRDTGFACGLPRSKVHNGLKKWP
eukprot:TRINITY_DN51718_c0_g1_i1.p2 TRINITY_DN51718_c0_g1~~TRINITY_DN51718_c0_g1_i1.p2  ORF type:complete len:168 (+),score=19.73 TRINITY_DN51718_c0_g1_i1:68-571(+)